MYSRLPSILFTALLIVFGVTSAGLYYYTFIDCVASSCLANVILPYNVPDHFIYLASAKNIDSDGTLSAWMLNHGISIVYWTISRIFFDGQYGKDFLLVTLWINTGVYVLAVVLMLRFLLRLRLPLWPASMLALYPAILLFSALINKDMFVMFLLLAIVNAFHRSAWTQLAVYGTILFIVRAQYVLFPFLLLYLSRPDFRNRLWITYVGTSLLAGIIAVYTPFFEIETSGLGFSSFIYEVNKSTYVGSLIFNPLRLLHYFASLLLAYFKVSDGKEINLLKLIEVLCFFYFLILLPAVYRFLRYSWRGSNDRGVIVVRAAIFSFLAVLLLTPINEPRYLLNIYPILLLGAALWRRARISAKLRSSDTSDTTLKLATSDYKPA